MSKTILVTGSSGFIGFNLSKLLMDNGDNVIGVDSYNNAYDPNFKRLRQKVLYSKNNFKEFELNLDTKENLESLEKENIDIVFHLAARAGVRQSFLDPISYIKDNSIATTNIANFVKDMNIKTLVLASTSSIYGDSGQEEMVEGVNEKIEPPSIYAASKKSNELMAHSYSHLYGLKTTGLRFFTVYGPWGRPDMALYIFTQKITKRESIQVYNHGNMMRDFTFVDDIIKGTRASIEKNYDCEIFNLGNNRCEELMDMIRIIEKNLGIKADIDFLDLQLGDVEKTFADIDHSKKMLGYSPKTSISEGIPEFINWFIDYSATN